MENYEIKKLSKISAARSQLETAIDLYFQEGDPVSIHALAANAREILSDLYQKSGAVPFLEECISLFIKKEKQREIRDLLRKTQNYIKHADLDTNKLYEFSSSETQFVIWEACELFKTLTKENPKPIFIYWFWFFMNHQDVLTHPQGKLLMRKAEEAYRRLHSRKSDFYEAMSIAHDKVASESPNITSVYTSGT